MGHSVSGVLFGKRSHDAVASGKLTVTFRLWTRPKVKVGGRYEEGPVSIEVDAIELVPFSSISLADARRSGSADLEALRSITAHSGPVYDDTLVYRVDFHVVDD
jgi:hypothetical protein